MTHFLPLVYSYQYTVYMKKWYQSKTIWYAIITGMAGIIAVFQTQYPEIGALAVANSIITVILRALTTSSIFPADEE